MPNSMVVAGNDRSGVAFTWVPLERAVVTQGWYDNGAGGMRVQRWTLEEFCVALGITAKDLEAVAKRMRAQTLAELVRKS